MVGHQFRQEPQAPHLHPEHGQIAGRAHSSGAQQCAVPPQRDEQVRRGQMTQYSLLFPRGFMPNARHPVGMKKLADLVGQCNGFRFLGMMENANLVKTVHLSLSMSLLGVGMLGIRDNPPSDR